MTLPSFLHNRRVLLVLGICIVVVAAIDIGIYASRQRTQSLQTITADMVIDGNYTIAKPLVIANGASLVVKGDLTVAASVTCSNGPLRITTQGAMTVTGSLTCASPSGIALVTEGDLAFSETARVETDGTVQIVANAADLITSDEALDALYEDAGKNTGGGTRLGPFMNTASDGVSTATPSATPRVASAPAPTPFTLVPIAHAAGTSATLRGTWVIGHGQAAPSSIVIPTPAAGIRHILLNFNFGTSGNVVMRGMRIEGPDGQAGENDTGEHCLATGKKGEDALRMLVRAHDIILETATITTGNGGNGGNAETPTGKCLDAKANGGAGGEPGNIKMIASGSITIGAMTIHPGVGGKGGHAYAYGIDGTNGCPGTIGGKATAVGGAGGANNKTLASLGNVFGVQNITIGNVIGGIGGDAEAFPGTGGSGIGCGCNGDDAGAGSTTAGRGGDATVDAASASAIGGAGGNANTERAAGGTGGSCGPDGAGGKGGDGADVTTVAGGGGSGATQTGVNGQVGNTQGGNGGNGGSGCGPGTGGAGGSGTPDGEPGLPGATTCVSTINATDRPGTDKPVSRPATEKPAAARPPASTPPPQEEPTDDTPSSSDEKINAMLYQEHYLPVEQLNVTKTEQCGAKHWVALNGSFVIATDGTRVNDPNVGCGYGMVGELQDFMVAPNAKYPAR